MNKPISLVTITLVIRFTVGEKCQPFHAHNGPDDQCTSVGGTAEFQCLVGNNAVFWQYKLPSKKKEIYLAVDGDIVIDKDQYSVKFIPINDTHRWAILDIYNATEDMDQAKYICVYEDYDRVSSCAELRVTGGDKGKGIVQFTSGSAAPRENDDSITYKITTGVLGGVLLAGIIVLFAVVFCKKKRQNYNRTTESEQNHCEDQPLDHTSPM